MDAATFLVSAALLMRVRERGAPATPAAGASSVRADLRAGFREVRSRAWVWATLGAFCVAQFVALAPLFVVGPIVAEERYGELAVYGYIFIAFGAGTVGGSLAALRWRPRYPLRTGIALVIAWAAAVALYAAGVPLALVVPAMAVGGAGCGMFDVWWLTALAERIPPDKLSRVTSYDLAVSLGLLPLGYVLAGPAATALGATNVLLGGALLAIVALALGLVPRETRMLARRETAGAPARPRRAAPAYPGGLTRTPARTPHAARPPRRAGLGRAGIGRARPRREPPPA